MNKWFISDTHLGHFNIIKYCNRPFSSLEEMDKTIIKNWNERVNPEDTVFHCGDFCFMKSGEAKEAPHNAYNYYKSQLNGNLILIMGNHEKNNNSKSIIQNLTIEHGGSRIFLTHNPKFSRPDITLNFCGHVHGKYDKFHKIGNGQSTVIDLSVENWDYSPVSINQI